MFTFDVEKEAEKAGATHANSANHANPEKETTPISTISTISTTTHPNLDGCSAELTELVNRVADCNGFTPKQRQDALEIALSDHVAALECFRILAARMG